MAPCRRGCEAKDADYGLSDEQLETKNRMVLSARHAEEGEADGEGGEDWSDGD